MEKVNWLVHENEIRKDVKDVVFERKFDIFDSLSFGMLFFSSNGFVRVEVNNKRVDDVFQNGDVEVVNTIDISRYLRLGENKISFKITSIDCLYFNDYKLNYEIRVVKAGGLMQFITPSNDDYAYYGNSITDIGMGYREFIDNGKYFDPFLIKMDKPCLKPACYTFKKYKGIVIETGDDYMIYDFLKMDYGFVSAVYRGEKYSTVKFEYLDESRNVVSKDVITLSGIGDEKYHPIFIDRFFRFLKVTFSEETVTVRINLIKKE